MNPVVTAIVIGCLATTASAQNVCCSRCGDTTGLRRTCRPVLTTKPVESERWDVIEEDIAVPLAHGLLACNCGSPGGECCASGRCRLCLVGGCRACCKVRPRNRLVRKTFLEEVPIVVWVVEYHCADCAAPGFSSQLHPAADTLPFPEASSAASAAVPEPGVQPPQMHAPVVAPPPESDPLPAPTGFSPQARRGPEALDELMKTLHGVMPIESSQ